MQVTNDRRILKQERHLPIDVILMTVDLVQRDLN